MAADLYTCSFCGATFTAAEAQSGCGGCPLSGGCRQVRCPRCGFELAASLPARRGWWRRRHRRGGSDGQGRTATGAPGENAVSLADLAPGREARIVDLVNARRSDLYKLAALGLLPGARVRVVQNFPSYVVQSGFTQIALDAETARQIRVEGEPGERQKA